jgi:hypothetical protein
MTDFEVRKVTRTVGETNATGQTTRDDTVYEVGTTIEDTFVRFATVTEEQLSRGAAARRERLLRPQRVAAVAVEVAPQLEGVRRQRAGRERAGE